MIYPKTISFKKPFNTFRIVVWMLVMLLTCNVYGNDSFWGKDSKNPKFTHLTVENGLSSNITSCILQDSRGFMWFGTDAGLNRYDGTQVTMFNTGDGMEKGGLSNGVIRSICEDSQQRIWVGTERGLNVYSPAKSTFQYFLANQENPVSLNNNTITAIAEDKTQQLWIGTIKGLHLLSTWDNNASPKFDRIMVSNSSGLKSDRIYWLLSDEDNNLWVGTEGGGVSVLFNKDRKQRPFKFTPLEEIINSSKIQEHTIGYSIYQSADSRIFIGTDKGLIILNKKQDSYEATFHDPQPGTKGFLQSGKIFSITEDLKGGIWIGTFGSGLYQFQQDGTFTQYTNNRYDSRSINRDYIFSLATSTEGIVWVATRETGIDRIDPYAQRFIHLKHSPNNKNSLANNVIKSIVEGPDGRFWFASYGGGLTVYNPKHQSFHTYRHQSNNRNSIASNIIESIAFDQDGHLWIGTSNGLDMLDPNKNTFTHYSNDPSNPNSLINNAIWSVYPGKNKKGIWVGTYEGLDWFDWETKKFIHFKNNPQQSNSLSFNFIRTIYETDTHVLWICTLGGGVSKADLNMFDDYEDITFTNFNNKNNNPASLANDLVNTIFEDNNNTIWVGTQGGLSVLDPKFNRFRNYFTQDGLPDNVIKGILQDQEGTMWISTQRGLCKFDSSTGKFNSYYYKDGLQANIFNLSSCLKSSKGEMLFGGNNGVTIFNPDEITEANTFPTVYLSSLSINNTSIQPHIQYNDRKILKRNLNHTSKITLNHSENNVSIGFGAIEYSFPEKIRFSYMLEGADTDWNYTDKPGTAIIYSSLKPGKYQFHVKASGINGAWNDKAKTIVLEVLPPLWATVWAKIVYFLLLIGIAVVIRQVILNRVQIKRELAYQKEEIRRRTEMNQFKLRFFTNISHEFRTPLTLISGPMQKLLKDGDNMTPDQIKGSYRTIDRNTQILLRLVNQLLDFRKAENEDIRIAASQSDLVVFITELTNSFNQLAEEKNIIINRELPDQFNCWFDAGKIEKIFFNLMSNAFKFTPENGMVSVRLKPLSESFILEVQDTGIGIPKDKVDLIFERYTQLKEGKSLAEGTGIGLAFVKRLVTLMRGSITVDSIPAQGSSFSIELPCTASSFNEEEKVGFIATSSMLPVSDSEITPTVEPIQFENNKSENGSNKPVILVVEDNADMRRFIADTLSSSYSILQAENGKEGLDIALAKGPDLVITDIMMPVMDGTTFCKKLKNNVKICHIPVIMLTAANTEEKELKGLETGADYYITKPFKVNQLLLIIKNQLQSRLNLQRKFSGPGIPEPEEVTVTSKDEKFLRKVATLIEEQIGEHELCVEYLAKKTGFSPVHFYRKIKSLTGMAPNNFIRSYRLKYAAQMLLQKKLRVSEIAYTVGFSDPKYFRKCFKNEYGLSPTAYIEEHLKEE
ncbi:hybrid sensor histidine kinase/response regulator [Puteibacter caeruleilacunae]|nr:hybrid sensor histidine kinase/response regulator [Puteibacter caeruleilacunae]